VTPPTSPSIPSRRKGWRDRPPLWGGLKPGLHEAGFRLACRPDFSRLYASPYRDTPGPRGPKRFRPVLQATWYPARQTAGAEAMRYRDYFDPKSAGPEFEGFLTPLFAFNLGMACRYGLHKPLTALDPRERAAVEAWLESPTAALKNGPPAAGRFPLVIYHPGLGSSYEDNAVFCEYLATHGYLVVSSAYPPEQADNIGIDGDFDRSARDFHFLLNSALAEPHSDPEHVAVMGHSYGAHTASGLLGLVNSPVDAVVSLDATLESVPSDSERLAGVRARLNRPERVTAPMLVFAGMRQLWTWTEGSEGHTVQFEPPFFEFYDALPYADRYYAAVRHLEHPDFVSQGAALGRIRRSLAGDEASGNQVWDAYERVCLLAHRFLDAVLKRDEAAGTFLRDTAHGAADAGSALLLRRVEAASPPPAPHHLMDILEAEGGGLEQQIATVAALCQRFPGPLDHAALRRAAQGLRQGQREPAALALLRLAADRHPDSAGVFCDLGDALEETGRAGEAADCYRTALKQIAADTALDEEARERAPQHPMAMLGKIHSRG